jgi:hypothetical protein
LTFPNRSGLVLDDKDIGGSLTDAEHFPGPGSLFAEQYNLVKDETIRLVRARL